MSEELNKLALKAKGDEEARENLIKEQQQMILRTASSASYGYVTTSDDEWAVALEAFSRAIDIYEIEKGDFLPFSQMLIKRALIDYHRGEKRAEQEIPTAPYILEGGGEPEEDIQGVYPAVVKISSQAADTSLKDEIIAANEMLKEYGFRFFDLTECSPRQDKTKEECAAAIRYVQKHSEVLGELKHTHKLPIKVIAKGSGVSKKILDRYRKYLIMAILILEGDYPFIAEYLKFVGKEEDA